MKTLIVPTVTVLTAALVNRDSLEMVQLVMVRSAFVTIPLLTRQNEKKVVFEVFKLIFRHMQKYAAFSGKINTDKAVWFSTELLFN